MKRLITLLALLCFTVTQAQVSVYDCQSNTEVTQTIINNAGSVFQQQCVEFPNTQTFLFTDDFNKEIRANQGIKIEPGFTAKAFSSVGGLKLVTIGTSPFAIAVMNYNDLSAIRKNDKLELGITLPTDIQTKVTNFLTNAVSGPKLNPFLEWDLRIIAEFKNEGASYTYPVDAFYFRNFVRNETTDYWDDLGTPYPFRVRFSPHVNGKWDCNIKIYVNNVLTLTSPTFNFDVVESIVPGFVAIHPNGKNLVREQGGEFIFPVGTNFPGSGGGESGIVDYNGDPNFVATYKMHYLKDYLNNVTAYADAGGKYFRYLVTQPNSEIEFEKLGNYYDRLMFATEIDNLVDFAHLRGMLIHFNLMLHSSIMKYADYEHYGWDFGTNDGMYPLTAYCYSTAFNTQTPSDMVLNTTTLVNGHPAFDYLKQRYRYYISRYGYSTSIELFEILSEPWHMNATKVNGGATYEPAEKGHDAEGDIARTAIRQWHSGIAEYIKFHLGHKSHLIATLGRIPIASTYGLEDLDTNGNYIPYNHTNAVQEDSWSDPNIDIATFSAYSGSPKVMVNLKENDEFNDPTDNNGFLEDEKSQAFSIHKIFVAYGKPSIIGEAGSGDDTQACSEYKLHEFYARRYGFSGVAGFNMWGGWTYGDPFSPYPDNHVLLWPSVINVQNHMNGYDVRDVISTNWVQGREVQKGNDEDKTREQQYYVSANQEECVGYVCNRTYNAYTLNTMPESKCSKYPGGEYDNFLNIVSCALPAGPLGCKQLEIQGLKPNTDYKIDWYHYGNGAYWYTDCFNTTINGVWRMDHPNLDIANPVVYYVIKQQNCSNQLATSNYVSKQQADLEKRSEILEIENPEWQLFPNPATNSLTILGSEPIQTIHITDAKGTLIYNAAVTDKSYEYELMIDHLVSGLYFITINNTNVQLRFTKL